MAENTDISLRNSIIYSVFVRNHTKEGTFRALIPDLPRIRALGADIIWLLPVHPIGVINRKGSLGCPYSIRDYRSVNPEYGTEDDFYKLAEEVHKNGMKLIIDVVYNHTSHDSRLLKEHPEWFYREKDGTPRTRISDWSDVIDLNYENKELWGYQIETLKNWARAVDGFRCDVASLVPPDFWKKARAECEKVKPALLWLAETVHLSFNAFCRGRGIPAFGDNEMFNAFDIEYEYDIRETAERYFDGKAPLSAWTGLLNLQEAAYPANYNKLRFLENHDCPRIASVIKDRQRLENLTAMLYFLKGATLLYAGQEFCLERLPSLFERDTIDRKGGRDISLFLARLASLKRTLLSPRDSFYAAADDKNGIAVITRDDGKRRKIGAFPLKAVSGSVKVDAPDGEYEERLFGGKAVVRGGMIECGNAPVIISFDILNN